MKKGLVHVFSSLGVIFMCQRLMKKGLVHVFSSLGVIFMCVRD